MRNRSMGYWLVAPLIAGSLTMAATACNRSTMEEKVSPTVIVTKADHGQTVKVAKGGQVTVKLTWSPGTGYDWVITKIDPLMLRQEGEASTEPAREPMPGAPETRVFQFRALKPGTTALEFQSRRSFDKEAPSMGEFRVQVLISE